MSRSETENRTEQLKKAVLSGQMTADELKDRLRRMINAELSKDDREIDADFVRACDDLLTELCGVPEPREDEFFEWQWAMIQRRIADRAERKRILIKASVIAAAAVLIVVLLGTVSIRLSWFHHYSTPDGQQYKIEGRQLTIDSGAIATEGDNVQNRLSSTDRNQIEEFLGFSLEGMIPDLEGWEIDNYFASFPSNYLIINIRYVNKKEKEKELGFIIHWLTDNADKDRFKQWSLDASDIDKVTTINEEKEIRNINGQIVIRTAVASEEEVGLNYLWSDGLTFYELFGLSADEVIESFVRTNTTEEKAVIEGAIFKKLDSLQTPKPEPTATPTPPAVITTEITSEVLAETVARHGGYKGTVTEKREEAEAWLGFALDSVMPVIAGWENEFYQMTIFPAEIILFTVIKNTQNIQEVVRYTIHWVLDQDQFMAPLEQDQEGEYHWVNGQFVYRGTNYQDVFHVWSNGIAVYMLHGVASDELIDRFVRVESPKERETEPAPVATTSPSIELPAPDEFYGLSDETISEIIERHHDQLHSDNLEEIEAFLGFSLRNILPEVKGWEAYHYHVAALYDNVFLLTDYRNQQDPNNKCRFKFQRFLNPETVYISVEQNEEGQYLRISGQQVYRSENYNSVSYTWTHGMTIYTLHGLTVDDIISQFVDTYNIEQNKPEPSPTPAVERTEVTAEMMASVVERRNCQPGELHSRLLADVESFLGFSMNGVLPDVEGWEAFDYHVDITADSVVVKTDYRNLADTDDVCTYIFDWYEDGRAMGRSISQYDRRLLLWFGSQKVIRGETGNIITYSWTKESFSQGEAIVYYYLSGKDVDNLIEEFLPPGYMDLIVTGSVQTPAPGERLQITDEIMNGVLARNGDKHQQLVCGRIEEIEAFLGISLRDILPVVEGWEIYQFNAYVSSGSKISMKANYWYLDDPYTEFRYTIDWYPDYEVAVFSLEQNEAGQYLWFGPQQVYRSENVDSVSYLWIKDSAIYNLFGIPVNEDLASIFVASTQ